MKNYKQLLKNIDTFIFDFDGVLSDGNVITTSDGDQLRVGSVKDGYAIQHAIKNNFRVVIISGGNSVSMTKRCEALGIKDCYFSVSDKQKMVKDFLDEQKISSQTTIFMGDDIPDYKAMQEVILPVCPADACNEIKSISKYISPFNGGRGCVRDIIEQVLKVQKKWMNENAFNW
jgi:3-deoxy-D-manno-octulosonate 8-phosphate phosphatase (KDO 8-P phosphatase)